ncbi:helix-turn-helix domain-containing protein [Deinococcus sp.]|uniref:helix-turn-helix domain-containing protein n=1 Tax=Deinococcus sp. TaxID=47478 RepID=UPI00345D840D
MLGPKITKRMSELGIKTQSDLASRTGLSVSYVNDLIRGTRGKRLGHMTTLKLAKALKVKPIFFRQRFRKRGKRCSESRKCEKPGGECRT